MNTESGHILVIDDNEDILFMLKAMFQFKGYKVSVKDNAENIENFIQDLSPDVILMDKLLSGADGCELCKKIKANAAIAAIPIVMISAMPRANEICLAAGANYFVEKPFEMDVILNTIATALEHKPA